jgi:pentatricopeptide repeat protein
MRNVTEVTYDQSAIARLCHSHNCWSFKCFMAISPLESSIKTAAVILYLLRIPLIRRNQLTFDIHSEKVAALLGYLALSRTRHGREQIQALLWPESSGGAARKNLRNLLWQIAQRWGHDLVIADAKHVRLSDGVLTDTTEFERIAADQQAAVAQMRFALFELYQSPPLDTLRVINLPQYELWLTVQQERFGRLHDELTTRLLQHYRQAQDWQALINIAHHAQQRGQIQESTYAALIDAYARLGERTKALHVYDQMCRWLANAHGIAPSEETRQLRQMIIEDVVSQSFLLPLGQGAKREPRLSRTIQYSQHVWDSVKDADEDTSA